MKIRNSLIIALAAFFVCMAANAFIVFADAIEIGNENAWLILKASGPVPIVTTKASGPKGELGVPVIVTDPNGLRMGFDPRAGRWIAEFPVSYDVFKKGPVDMTEETEYLYVNDAKYRKEYDDGTDYVLDIAFNLIQGDYVIEAIGERLTDYTLTAVITRKLENQSIKSTTITFDGVVEKGLSSKFMITYNPDPRVEMPGAGKRISAPASLKQDITLSRKIGWIDNDGIMNSLVKKVDAVEASIAKGNMKTARNQLNALINEVNAQKGKQISDKAIKILVEDFQYIMDGIAK